jgi:exopolysaccharide production protein ExoQ
MNRLILLAFWGFAIWLIRRDMAGRKGISSAIWIPTFWVGILASRPDSSWLGFGRLFFFGMIFAALITLSKRGLDWGLVISRSWPIFLFYFYLLVSVMWADSPISSFKRWFKDLGNVWVALVILTEVDPQQAFRAVFVRCAYVLLPMSVVFIRWFPDLGRRYSMHSGELEPIGVTFQKNSLGALVLVCGLVLIWDWFERSRPGSVRQEKLERYLPVGLLLIGAYLLYLCDSKTSLLCLILGAGILAASRLPLLRKRLGILSGLLLGAVVLFFVLDSLFGIKEGLEDPP